jgi:hypothetical protein
MFAQKILLFRLIFRSRSTRISWCDGRRPKQCCHRKRSKVVTSGASDFMAASSMDRRAQGVAEKLRPPVHLPHLLPLRSTICPRIAIRSPETKPAGHAVMEVPRDSDTVLLAHRWFCRKDWRRSGAIECTAPCATIWRTDEMCIQYVWRFAATMMALRFPCLPCRRSIQKTCPVPIASLRGRTGSTRAVSPIV